MHAALIYAAQIHQGQDAHKAVHAAWRRFFSLEYLQLGIGAAHQ